MTISGNNRISVVIPVYNEAERIARVVADVRAYLQGHFDAFEIIVVDDGSADQSATIVASLAETDPVIRRTSFPENRGKGACIKAGIMAAKYDLVYMCDADLAAPIEELGIYVPWAVQGYDIVIGSRAAAGAEIVIPQPWYRKLMGTVFNRAVQLIVLKGISDTQCGFKLFRRDAARRIAERSRIDRFSFDVEMLFLARQMGFRVKEVGVRWINDPDSRVRIVADSMVMLKDLVRIRWNHFRGRYAA